MSKAEETFRESALSLREWLVFLDQKEAEYQSQVARARRTMPATPPPQTEQSYWLPEDEEAPAPRQVVSSPTPAPTPVSGGTSPFLYADENDASPAAPDLSDDDDPWA
jgi:hypothetical protein